MHLLRIPLATERAAMHRQPAYACTDWCEPQATIYLCTNHGHWCPTSSLCPQESAAFPVQPRDKPGKACCKYSVVPASEHYPGRVLPYTCMCTSTTQMASGNTQRGSSGAITAACRRFLEWGLQAYSHTMMPSSHSQPAMPAAAPRLPTGPARKQVRATP
jgi:hypothetical protein